MANKARYSVGIDLGTTNSAMACADLGEDATLIEMLKIPQLVNAAEVQEQSLLPSFLYVAGEFDFPQDSLRLPWGADAAPWVVGELARKRGSENPARLVASAKSWLSYAGASRTAPILPWSAPEEVPKLSPVAASAHYLRHLKHAWDARFAAGDPALALDLKTRLVAGVVRPLDAHGPATEIGQLGCAGNAGRRRPLDRERDRVVAGEAAAVGDGRRDRVRADHEVAARERAARADRALQTRSPRERGGQVA